MTMGPSIPPGGLWTMGRKNDGVTRAQGKRAARRPPGQTPMGAAAPAALPLGRFAAGAKSGLAGERSGNYNRNGMRENDDRRERTDRC